MPIPVRGHLRMRVESPLTGATVELVEKPSYDARDRAVVMVRLLEPAGNYPSGATLYVGADEFIPTPQP